MTAAMQTHADERDPRDVQLGLNVAAAMKKYGNVKGKMLAPMLEMDPTSYSARLNGRVPFKATELIVIADCLGCRVGEFFDGVQTPTSWYAQTASDLRLPLDWSDDLIAA